MNESQTTKAELASASAFAFAFANLRKVILTNLMFLCGWNAHPAEAIPVHATPNKATNTSCTIVSGGNEILGGFKTYVSAKAVRVQSLSSKWYLITRAPDWHVTLYNPTNNQGMSMSLQKWMNHTPQFVYWPVPPEFEQWHVYLSTKIDFLGHPCLKNIVFKTTTANKRTYRSKNNDYILLDNNVASVESCHVVQILTGVPLSERIPLCFSMQIQERDDKNTKKYLPHYILKSITIEDSAMPAEFFAYPTGYKTVKREVDVISDTQTQLKFENIIGPLTEPTK